MCFCGCFAHFWSSVFVLQIEVGGFMNWFDVYKNDFGFKSNYALSKNTGITRSSLDVLETSKDWHNVKIGTMILLARAANKSLDDFVEYLRNQKKRTTD